MLVSTLDLISENFKYNIYILKIISYDKKKQGRRGKLTGVGCGISNMR